MGDIEAIMKTISEFGILVVIAGIFIYTAIRVINIFLKRLDDNIGRKKHEQSLDIRQDVNNKIQSLLDQFLLDHDGGRLQVVEFSNSIVSVAYLPFRYMTCTYEVYKIGKSPKASLIDRLSTSLFTKFFSTLYDNEVIELKCCEPDERYGHSIYDLVKESDDCRSLFAILKTSRGKSLGYVCFKKESQFSQDDLDDIPVLADKISALLGIMDK